MFLMLRLDLVIPRSVMIIDSLLLILMMGGSRFVYRMWKEHGLYGDFKLHGEAVLVLGAGDVAASLAKELVTSRGWRLVGFLDDEIDKHRRMLNGIRVLGKLESLPHPKLRIAQARQADAAWLAQLLKWVSATVMEDDAVRAALTHWVPEYQPSYDASIREVPSAQNPSTLLSSDLSKKLQGGQA